MKTDPLGRPVEVQIVQYILTTLCRRGTGSGPESPIRTIWQYWDMEGNLVTEIDSSAVILSPEGVESLRKLFFEEIGETGKSKDVWQKLSARIHTNPTGVPMR